MFQNSALLQQVRKNERGSHFLIELFKFFFVIFTVTYFANRVHSFIANRDIRPFSGIPGLWNFAMAFLAVGAIFYCLLWEKMDLRQMGLLSGRRVKTVLDYGMGLGLGVLIIAAIVGVCLLFGALRLESSLSNVRWLPFLVIFASYLVQGLGEELLFRGAFLLATVRKNHPVIAVLITSLFFSLWHYKTAAYGVLPAVNLFLFGVFCAVSVFVFDHVWFAGAFHAAWNFAQAHVFGACVSGSQPKAEHTLLLASAQGSAVLSGGAYGPEGSAVTTGVLLLAIAALVLYDRSRSKSGKKP